MKRILSSLLLGVSLATFGAPATGVRVEANIDSAVVVMGDRVNLKVVVTAPEALSKSMELVDFPYMPVGQEFIDFHGVDIVEMDSTMRSADGHTAITFDYTLQPFDPETYTIPPFAVVPVPGGDTIKSKVLSLKVLPVEVDSLETINPMTSVVSAQSRWYDFIPNWLFWLLGAVAVAAGGYFAYMTLRRRQVEIAQEKAKPVPPYELAISRLGHLKAQRLTESGHEKEYYTELVDILRQYLDGRFHINAMEMTSTQIVRALRSNPDTRMTADQVRSILAIADFVKFAKVRPMPDDNVKAYNRALDFVETTKPAPEPETPDSPETETKKD